MNVLTRSRQAQSSGNYFPSHFMPRRGPKSALRKSLNPPELTEFGELSIAQSDVFIKAMRFNCAFLRSLALLWRVTRASRAELSLFELQHARANSIRNKFCYYTEWVTSFRSLPGFERAFRLKLNSSAIYKHGKSSEECLFEHRARALQQNEVISRASALLSVPRIDLLDASLRAQPWEAI